MSDVDQESKTEDPTDKRRTDFREEGKTAFSRELAVFVSFLVIALYLSYYVESDVYQFGELFGSSTGWTAAREISPPAFLNLVKELGLAVATILAPFVVALTVGSLFGSVQSFPRIVAKRITPEWSRISPMAGLKRLLSANNGFEFLKSLAKLALALLVISFASVLIVQDLVVTVYKEDAVSAQSIIATAKPTAWLFCTIAGGIAVADFAWQRRSWLMSLKMTRQEVKDEFKQADGDPVVKARMRAIARDKSRKRMMQAVPTATLIIANPTHICVALRYDSERDAAPVVVATGADLIAHRIRAIAEENGVPVFERIDLARALYRSVKVNQIIPIQFYAALAELIRLINSKTR
ncbi:MAG: flagellar type III secretion system protein FlhB [Rhizobiaceae bacterium]